MKTEFEISKYSAGGGKLKIKGSLTVKESKTFKDHLLELSDGNCMLSFTEIQDIDISAIQLLWSFRKLYAENGKRLTITWPQNDTVKRKLTKTGLLKSIQN